MGGVGEQMSTAKIHCMRFSNKKFTKKFSFVITLSIFDFFLTLDYSPTSRKISGIV